MDLFPAAIDKVVHDDRLAEGIVHVPARGDPRLEGFERLLRDAAVIGLHSRAAMIALYVHTEAITRPKTARAGSRRSRRRARRIAITKKPRRLVVRFEERPNPGLPAIFSRYLPSRTSNADTLSRWACGAIVRSEWLATSARYPVNRGQ